MKKLVYDKETKEIVIEEIESSEEKEPKIIKIKKFFEKYKIFFEIFSSVLLAIMSFVISIVGIQINKRNSETNKRQLEIAENDREPYFVIKSETLDEKHKEGNYEFTIKLYTITNEGGLITGAYSSEIYKYAVVKVFNEKSYKQDTYILYFNDIFEKTEGIMSLYNDEKKEFKFCEKENNKFDKLITSLSYTLKEKFPAPGDKSRYTAQVNIKNTIKIEYINYKNEEYVKEYQFMTGDRMILINDENVSDEVIYLGWASIYEDIEDVVQDVCDEIEEFIKFGKIEHTRQQEIRYYDVINSVEYDKKRKKEALDLAKRYLHFAYSRDGLIEKLEVSEKFSHEEAVYAVDNCGAIWNQQAIMCAKNYLLFKNYSLKKLVEDLETYEKFTHKQAVFAAHNCRIDWNKQALYAAEDYLTKVSFFEDGLIKQLERDGFTHEQAVFAAKQKGY